MTPPLPPVVSPPGSTPARITVGSWPGKRLACFVDGVRVFHMAKREHKAFYQRVERLRKQARVDAWLAERRAAWLAEPIVETVDDEPIVISPAQSAAVRSEVHDLKQEVAATQALLNAILNYSPEPMLKGIASNV